jgi:hypothetical protein
MNLVFESALALIQQNILSRKNAREQAMGVSCAQKTVRV